MTHSDKAEKRLQELAKRRLFILMLDMDSCERLSEYRGNLAADLLKQQRIRYARTLQSIGTEAAALGG